MSDTTQNKTNPKTMLTIREVGVRLGVSLALVYREIHQGHLKAHRFAKRTYRISLADLEDYIASSSIQCVNPQPGSIRQSDELPQGSITAFKHISVRQLLVSRK